MKLRAISVLRIAKNALEMASIIAMAAFFVLFSFIFKGYPENSAYSFVLFSHLFIISKTTLFVLFFVAAGLNGLLFILYRFPSCYHYPFRITAENIEMQYHLAKIMLSCEQILITLLFGSVFITMYANATQQSTHPFTTAMIIFPICIALVYGIYIALARRYR